MQKKLQKLQEQKSKFFTEEDLKTVFLFPEKESDNSKYLRRKYGGNVVTEKSLSWKRK